MAMTQSFLDSLVGKRRGEAEQLCIDANVAFVVCPVGYHTSPEVDPNEADKVTLWLDPNGYITKVEPWDPNDVTP